MKHFKKWVKDKNPFLAVMSLTIAGFSKECFELFESIRKGKRLEGDLPLPSLKTWLKLYRNPKRIGRVLFNALCVNYNNTVKSEQLKDELVKMISNNNEKRNEITYPTSEEFKEFIINDFESETNEAKRKEFLKNLTKPEIIFFFRVMAPCFSLYGTYPIELLNKAQNGDDDALEKLIRLDKSIIFEPKISEIIHQAQALKAQAKMSMIKKAFISKPKVKIKMKTIKCHLGGLISYFSEKLNQKITAAEIRNLFDAISLDMNDDIDNDLDDLVGESFEKAIQRSRNFWHIILPSKI